MTKFYASPPIAAKPAGGKLLRHTAHTFLLLFVFTTPTPLLAAFAFSVVPQSRDAGVGAEMAKKVEEEIGIYRTPVLSDYVAAIGSRLVGNLEDNQFTFQFDIVDQFEPNAFAVPGGWVYISRGLLWLANSEDEVAGVIGHEITPVTKRHSASRQRRGILGGILQVPGNIVVAVVGDDIGRLLNAPLNTIGQLGLANYSRGQENESDRLGMRLAARSGNRWTPEYTALINDLPVDRTMEAGTLVKIARREHYRPR